MTKDEMKLLLRAVGYESARQLGCSQTAWLEAIQELLEEEKQRARSMDLVAQAVNPQRN